MDPATIAASVIAILSPYAKDAGTELVKTAGEVAVAKAKVLFGWLKEKLSGDPVAASDLNRFEANPEKFSAGLQGTLEVQAKRDPGFAAELQKRVQEIQAEITVFQKFREAKNVTGVDSDTLPAPRISVHQEGDSADGVTGVRIRSAK